MIVQLGISQLTAFVQMALLPWQISSFLKGTLELAVPAYHGEKWHVMLFSLVRCDALPFSLHMLLITRSPVT